jgi:hypothetical protein
MGSILTGLVTGPVAWKGKELAREQSWIYRFSERGLAEIDTALHKVKREKQHLHAIRRADFPLPSLRKDLQRISMELEHGRGFVQMKGLPIDRYQEDEARIIYWGIAAYLGTPVSQNSRGHLIGDVRDEGLNIRSGGVRGYQTNSASPFHADETDIVSLLCLRPAMSGGLSCIVSSMAIHNELLARYPWYVALLYRPFNFDWRGEQPAGGAPVYRWPVYEYFEGRLTCRYSRRMIEFAQATTGMPLSRVEKEAFDILDELIRELRLDIEFETGDIQFLNNYSILHSRTDFEDYPEPRRKRHLLRLWLTAHDGRKLSTAVTSERNVRNGVPCAGRRTPRLRIDRTCHAIGGLILSIPAGCRRP